MNAQTALEAIRARINGEWDNPALVAHGPLKTNPNADILDIIAAVQPDDSALAERERIASRLDEEAELTPCAEDAVVIQSCADLVRSDFSYDDAEAYAISKGR